MRRKRVILETVEDKEGIFGLVVQGTKLIDTPMAALEGRMIAHDLIEHINGVEAIGSIDDELEAFGACWFVRGQYSDMSRSPYSSGDPTQGLGRDVAFLGEFFMRGVDFREAPPRTHECIADDSLSECIGNGEQYLKSELEYYDEPINRKRLNQYIEGCLPFMRRGYRKAKKKYDKGTIGNTLFWNIAEAVDRIVDYVEFPGQEFELLYDLNGAMCHEHYSEESY